MSTLVLILLSFQLIGAKQTREVRHHALLQWKGGVGAGPSSRSSRQFLPGGTGPSLVELALERGFFSFSPVDPIQFPLLVFHGTS